MTHPKSSPLSLPELMIELKRNERAWTYMKVHALALQKAALGSVVSIREDHPEAELLAGLYRALTTFLAELDHRTSVASRLLTDASTALGLTIPAGEDDDMSRLH